MYRCASMAAAAIVAVAMHTGAAAQMQRAFPTNTLRGTLVFGEYPQVTLNGKAVDLSPASQVRDQNNRIVMAASLQGQKALVHFTWQASTGQLGNVWILTPDEAAISPWPRTLDEAQSWSYDPTTQTWTKP